MDAVYFIRETMRSCVLGNEREIKGGEFYVKRTLAILLTIALAMELSANAAMALPQTDSSTALKDSVKDKIEGLKTIKVASMSPAAGATGVNVGTELILTFTSEVEKGSGNITVRKKNGDKVEDVAVDGSQVRLDDTKKKATITLSKPLDSGTSYRVQADFGTFKSGSSEFLGIYDPTEWTFTTAADTGAPQLDTVSPAIGQRDVRVDSKLVLTFKEKVWKQSGGSVIMKQAKDGKVLEALPMSSNRVTGDGTNTITIDPVQQLKPNMDYTIEIAADSLRNASGKSYAGLNTWKFTTGNPDTVAPSLKSAVLSKVDTIRLTFDKELKKTSVPPAASFEVWVNGDTRRVTGTAMGSDYVDVSLENGVPVGQSISISYRPGADRKSIQDTAGNAAAAFEKVSVSNEVDRTPPVMKQANAEGMKVVLDMSEPLDTVSARAYEQFKVTVDGSEKTVSRISVDGSKVTLSLIYVIRDNQTVRVSYKPDRYPLTDRSGNKLEAFTDVLARNDADTKAPVLQRAEVSGSLLTLTYNEQLDTGKVPPRSHFSVYVNRSSRSVDSVQVRDNVVNLIMSSSVSDGDDVTVSYMPGTGEPRISDLAGNKAAVFTLKKVDNGSDRTAPTLRSASVKGSTMTLVFSERLKELPSPDESQFVVHSDNRVIKVKRASTRNEEVTLTLDEAVNAYSAVTVAYLQGKNPIKDLAGNSLQSFASTTVTNKTDGSTTRPGDLQPATFRWFLDDGWYLLSSSAADTSSDRSLSGSTAKRYTIPATKLKSSFEYVLKNGTRNHLAFDVPTSERGAVVAVPLQTLNEVYNKANDAIFSIRYGDILMSVPLRELDFRALEREWGNNQAYLLLQAESQSGSDSNALLRSLNDTGARVRVNPIEFRLSAFAGSATPRTIEANLKYKVRNAQLIQRSNASAVRYDSVLNKAGYVPTVTKQELGVAVYAFQFKGNRSVAMMDRSKDFSDIKDHWGRDAIRELASKYIIEGVSNNAFAPNANITRGQFAILLARSLGLQADASGASAYRDVNQTSMMAPYIGAATKAGIIGGYENGTFRPNESINREQMAIMLVRAMEYTGRNVASNPSALNKFNDRGQVSSYARDGVGKAVSAGIVQGMTANTFQPKATATRAQAAVMLKRMLEQIEYLG
ncbi:repeat-containing protein [Paenibacillus sp. cl6col]|nr:repeat-containing protein [Paenibacillus sp. cl6col]